MEERWYKVGKVNDFYCLNCNSQIKVMGLIHPEDRWCVNCKVPSLFYGLGKNVMIQILIDETPKPFHKFKKWFQEELTEAEFFHLFAILHGIGNETHRVKLENDES